MPMNIYREYSKLTCNIPETKTEKRGRKHEKCQIIYNHDIKHAINRKVLDRKSGP